MSEPTELDQRIEDLRRQVRAALLAGDRDGARVLRRQLRDAEQAWHDSLADLDADGGKQPDKSPASQPSARPPLSIASDSTSPVGMGEERDEPSSRQPRRPRGGEVLLPMREQVHQALTLLTVPAGPRLISAVHEAMFSGAIPAARLTSVRRDEERSFRTAPFARPYYLCAALTADLLSPSRGLLAISTWPMDRRIIGPLSPRVDYLTAAVRIAENVGRNPDSGDVALRLLWRFAANIPGANATKWQAEPSDVVRAARAELEIHAEADEQARRSAATRARRQLDDAQQLFGARLTRYSQAQA